MTFQKGHKGYWLGKKFSIEHRKKLSKFQKGKELSTETKNKISKTNSGINNPFYGKKHSEKTKKKLSELIKGKRLGKNNPMYGKTGYWSGKKRPEISEMNSGSKNPMHGKKHSKEAKRKMSEMTSGPNNPSWKGGITTDKYCPVFKQREWREILFERDKDKFCWNPQCEGRGTRECLHHINYDKKNCHPSNIIKVCNSCNSMANKDRDWWEAFYKVVMERRKLK